MREISVLRALTPNCAVLAVMTAMAWLVTHLADIDGSALPMAYVQPAAIIAMLAMMAWIALAVMDMALRGEPHPARALKAQFVSRKELLLLPIIIQPLFFAAFTAAKTGIAPLMSFTWDGAYTAIDAAIFAGDPWRLTHAAIGPNGSRALEFFYTMVWGGVLVFIQPFMAIYGSCRSAGIFFLALNLTWMIGGIVVAFMTPAAGPIFAHLFDATLTHRFTELRVSLLGDLDPDGAIFSTQDYLVAMLKSNVAEEGGGISAMPSMHVATAMLYVFAARQTRWFWPAIVFTVLTCIGSVHFGYHYAVDGLVAIFVAGSCWRLAEKWFERAPQSRLAIPGGAPEAA